MDPWPLWLIGAGLFPLIGYLIGSIPFGYLAGRLRGLDIRDHGSRNVGATNAVRVLGRPIGLAVFALDVLKGAVPVVAAGWWLHHVNRTAAVWVFPFAGPKLHAAWLLTAFAAIAGHIWPIWLRFRGGKGVATALGAVLGLYPFYTLPGLVALDVWVVVTLLSRYVSLGSICAAVAFPAALIVISAIRRNHEPWQLGNIWPLLAFAVAMPLLVIWRHRANIARLLAGTESKIGSRRGPAKEGEEGPAKE